MKKYVILLLTAMLFLTAATTVEAKGWQLGRFLSQASIKGERKEIKEATTSSKVKESIWEGLRRSFPFILPAGVNQATISSIGGTTLPTTIIVNKESKNITLSITEKTIILRKFGGKSSLSELHIGDIVTARGTWVDETKAVLDTRVLRDLSIQKRHGTFWGKIKSINVEAKTFALETAGRGDQQVFVDGTTKIVSRNQKVLTFTDLIVGHRVRVTGLWDSTLKTISEVKTIKDWTLSPKPTLTPTPTPI